MKYQSILLSLHQVSMALQVNSVPSPKNRRVRDCAEAFFGDVIDYVLDEEAAVIGELVVNKVQRSTYIRLRFDLDWHQRANSFTLD